MINALAKEVHKNAKSKGFYEGEKNIGEMLALIHSEVSEALEADRKNRYADGIIWLAKDMDMLTDGEFLDIFKDEFKDTFEDELADTIIRIFDLAAYKRIDLESHIKAKMRFNALREYKHGGKKY